MPSSNTRNPDFDTFPEPEGELMVYKDRLQAIQMQVSQLRDIRTLSSKDVLHITQELEALIRQMTKESVLRPTDAAYISIRDAMRELNIVLDLFDNLEEGYSNALKSTFTEVAKRLRRCEDYLSEAVATLVPVSLSILQPQESRETATQAQSISPQAQTNEVLTLATKYSTQIKKARRFVQDASQRFSTEQKVSPVQCEKALYEIRKLSEPVSKLYGLLDVAVYLMVDTRYQLLIELRHIDEMVSELTSLITALRDELRGAPKKVSSQQQKIRQRLESLLDSLDEVNISFSQLHRLGKSTGQSFNEAPIIVAETSRTKGSPAPSIAQKSVDRSASPLDPGEVSRTQLLQVMSRAYDLPEMKQLCYDLQVRYDTLRGVTLEQKLIYLIDDAVRRHTYENLVRQVLADHPNVADELQEA